MVEEMRSDSLNSTGRLKDILISFAVSLALVGFLVGNAYLTYNVGGGFEPLALVGLVFLIPPGFVYGMLSGIGLMPELRGRESFIESNPWLWIFCVIFYTVVIYMILRWINTRKDRGTQNDDDFLKKREALKRYGILK